MNKFIIDLFDDIDPADSDPQDPIDPVGDPIVKKNPISRVTAKDPDTEIRLRELHADLAKSNAEAAQRRRENKELKSSVEKQQKDLDAFKSRTVRTEARAALAEKGVVHKDVLDIFLKTASDKIQVDDSFDVLGIDDALEAFTKTHAVFFKAPKVEETPEEKTAREELEKSNKTSNGSSIKGSAESKTSTANDPNDKRSASQILADMRKTVPRS